MTNGNQNVYHWLLYKDILSEEEIFTGFQTKHQFKDGQTADWTLISCTIRYLKKRKYKTSWELVKEEHKKNIPRDELNTIGNEWKAKSDDNYDYDVEIIKD